MNTRSLLISTALTGAVLAGSVVTGVNTTYATDLEPVDECRKDIALKLSGQVNRAVLYADNGEVDDTFFVDNDNSSTRLRVRAVGDVTCDFKVGAQIEVQFESNSSAAIRFDQSGDAGPNNFTERKLEVWFDSEMWGRLWLGQGDTASNGTSEVDLSGTSVIAYSAVEDFAGGLEFENGQRIGAAFSNYDGLSRDDRVRYDTPTLPASSCRRPSPTTMNGTWRCASPGSFGGHRVAAAVSYVDGDRDKGFPPTTR